MPAKSLGEGGLVTKHRAYILQSISRPEQFDTGLCSDVRARLAAHNAGQSPHTAKYKPWKLLSGHWFADEAAAAAFENYLKAGSGRAFALKRLPSRPKRRPSQARER